MSGSEAGAVAVEFRQNDRGNADGGHLGPMSQQNAVSSLGFVMYPQKFVRLVGCHAMSAGDITRCEVPVVGQQAVAA